MRSFSQQELIRLYDECHGPSGTPGTHVMQWAVRMERKLGPDDPRELKGFLIRGRQGSFNGLYLHADSLTWSASPFPAKKWSWGETAIKITNNPMLEAIRINELDVAVDSKGRAVVVFMNGRDNDG